MVFRMTINHVRIHGSIEIRNMVFHDMEHGVWCFMTIFRFFRFAGVSRMQVGGKVLGAEWAGHGSGPWDKLEIRTGFFGVCVV